jgi:SAM-dependent methyltransferase
MCAPQDWENFDASPTVRFERVPFFGRLYTKNATRFPPNVRHGDIVAGLPVPEASCDGVYCSHVLEHLSRDAARTAIRNTFALLRPGGRFRLVVPDLECLVRRYLEDPSPDACSHFMEKSMLGEKSRPRDLRGMSRALFGNSAHLWMWDYKGLAHELDAAGFTDIRRAVCGDSNDPMFALVESADRYEEAVGIDCRRPLTR